MRKISAPRAVGLLAIAAALLLGSCASSDPGPPAAASVATTRGTPLPVASSPPLGRVAADVDHASNPCAGFYDYAGGAWRKEHPIPPGKARWSRRGQTHDANAQQVSELLAEVATKADVKKGSADQLLRDFYGSCLDEGAVNAAALSPLRALLDDIDRADGVAEVQALVRRLHEVDIGVAFHSSTDLDYADSSRTILQIAPGALGMPAADFLRQDADGAQARDRYLAHVTRVLSLGGSGAERAAKEARSVVALETRLAGAVGPASEDPAAAYHLTTYADLERLAPHVDWKRYFDDAGVPRSAVNVADPGYLRKLDAQLAPARVDEWKAYLRYQLLDTASPWLGADFSAEAARFHHPEAAAGAHAPRAQECVEATRAVLGNAVGQKYAERYFPPASKAKVQAMLGEILQTLKDDVARVTWMEPATKEQARRILDQYDIQVGYPDRPPDYGDLVIWRDQLAANNLAVRRFTVREARSRAGKPTVRDLWQLDPSSPDAYIAPELDQMVLPAGFLQSPTFDANAPDAVNFGAIGVGVAHDMTHAIDATGAEVDPQGRHRRWWTAADQAGFEHAAQCVVDQATAFDTGTGAHQQGAKVRNEAVGDLAGVQLALATLHRRYGGSPGPSVDGLTADQQFFLAYGQFRGDALRPETARTQLASDIHPLPRFRVENPLQNFSSFQTAFACTAPSPMVLAPAQRCRVW